ncbi:hypothetical protein E0Z10_g10641 [Xylaria hypoxylon]|uniref:F-box domain-containing protein n=1 Tax=Xylaria hypoxylon TaxID=37992 RepID=A0A4Z0YFW2_9PEZI|nr:hypothetical protein E0Z10_g10641 [Xylaria hypoxylon]
MPREKGSARPEEAEPTRAQKKKIEREEVIRQVKKRQARHGERPVNPAYDYRASKQRKDYHGQKLARRPHWQKKSKFKKSLSPSDSPAANLSVADSSMADSSADLSVADSSVADSPAANSPLDQDRIDAVCGFAKLPTEIRDEILRHILLWPHDIVVFRGWSRVYPRLRPRLNLSILSTCRMLRDQGLQILFGENTFAYDLRDPEEFQLHTDPVLEKVFGDSVVPINQYGHLIRHAKVKVNRSRIHFSSHRHGFVRAILKFLPGRGLAGVANLHTLTLEVPAERNSEINWISIAENRPDEVPICRYLQDDSKIASALFELRVQWVRILAWDRSSKCWETKLDMRYFVKDEQMRIEHEALNKDDNHNTADVAIDGGIAGDTSAATSYRTNDIDIRKEAWDRGVKDAVGGLSSLAERIKLLVADPDRAVAKGLWQPVATPNDCGPESNTKDELVSLPSNWRERSFPTNMPSGRSRTTSSRSNLNITPSAKTRTKSGAKSRVRVKSNTKVRTKAETNTDDLNIFNAGDAANEARLLEAQQGIQGNKTKPGQSSTLTEEWLENLPEHDAEDNRGPVRGDGV